MTTVITKEQLAILIGGAFAGVGLLSALKAQDDIMPEITHYVQSQINKMFESPNPSKLTSGVHTALLITNLIANPIGRAAILAGTCFAFYSLGSMSTKACLAEMSSLKA